MGIRLIFYRLDIVLQAASRQVECITTDVMANFWEMSTDINFSYQHTAQSLTFF